MPVTAEATAIRSFRIEVPEEQLTELLRRIEATRWPSRELVSDRSQGVQLATLQALARYWTTEHDWRKCEARLNALPQFTTELDGVEIDSSFYALPSARTVEGWAKRTPERFEFTAKLHRALSRHAAPLNSLPTDLREGVETTGRGRVVLTEALEAALCERTLEVFEPLFAAGRLRCLLLQLTPAFNPADHALDELEPLIQALAPVPVADASSLPSRVSCRRSETLNLVPNFCTSPETTSSAPMRRPV